MASFDLNGTMSVLSQAVEALSHAVEAYCGARDENDREYALKVWEESESTIANEYNARGDELKDLKAELEKAKNELAELTKTRVALMEKQAECEYLKIRLIQANNRKRVEPESDSGEEPDSPRTKRAKLPVFCPLNGGAVKCTCCNPDDYKSDSEEESDSDSSLELENEPASSV